jgi:uncharacterized protein YbjT (DUF2867 family)
MALSSLPVSRSVAVTGATGYLGRALIPELLARGHRVRALVRAGSRRDFPAGVEAVTGDALKASDIAAVLIGTHTLVHLVGVPKPSPAKARQFRAIDLVSIQAAVSAALQTAPRIHVVYLSVAQPAPVMKAYVAVRQEGETLLRAGNLDATCLRPWYVLGPGHWWPCVLLPLYALLRFFPATRASAERLGFVTLRQMVAALVHAVENPGSGVRVIEVPQIRTIGNAVLQTH